MKKVIEPVMYIIELAKKSMIEAGVTPNIVSIRGGTIVQNYSTWVLQHLIYLLDEQIFMEFMNIF